MTIPVQVPRNSYIGDGANDRYAFTIVMPLHFGFFLTQIWR